MSPLFELLLAAPLSPAWGRVLLFSGFYLHIALVLFALGTAFLAVFYCVATCVMRNPVLRGWDKRILRTFLGLKSLAVVLGVAPLLLIQVVRPLPFFNATGLLAGPWMLVIVLLMVSFVSFDVLGHRMRVHPLLHLGSGLAALVLFAAVPGVFVAVLVAAENPASWTAVLQKGGVLPGSLTLHWLARYLHVLAAAVVFGALFHYFFTSGGDPVKRAEMRRWLLAGIFAQLMIGPALIVSLPDGMPPPAVAFLGIGLLALAVFVRLAAGRGGEKRALDRKTAVPLLMGVLLFMLFVRQTRQDRAFAPIEEAAAAGARARAAALAPYEAEALAGYREDMLRVSDDGPAIYGRSCAFCHGANGAGRGTEADNLAVPPEDISQIRASRPYLLKVLAAGVPGTAMPYFSIFVRDKLEALIGYLDERWEAAGTPPAMTGIAPEDIETAGKIYGERCASCHGPGGRPMTAAAKFAPPPPDFAEFSVLPQRAIQVFTHGYPGTMMGPFGAGLSPELQTALVQVLYDKRRT